MRPAALVVLTVLAALVMLGAATSTWATVTVPTPAVDGVPMPDQTTDLNGAAETPASVVAAGLGFLTALPLGLISLADRAGAGNPTPGQAVRALATLLAAGTVVASALAVVQVVSVQVATLGGVQPTIAGTAAPGIFGLAALVVLLAASGGWRVGQQPPTQADRPSRYTVEAVRGDVGPTSDQGEPDEWDLAVDDAGDTAPPAGARP